MSSHLVLLTLFAVPVSLVFAMLMRDEPRAQLRLWGMLFLGFLASAVVLGWLMYPLPF
jgi:hypothetical protein